MLRHVRRHGAADERMSRKTWVAMLRGPAAISSGRGRKREERTAGRPGQCVPRSKSGDVLLSQGISPQVPSALTGLTSVFGMGTGVTLSLWSPKSVVNEGSPQGLQSKHELFKTKPSAD
jgi:hypothetical protein